MGSRLWAGGPFWVSDNGSGWSTLYDGQGVKQGLVVLIPSESGAGPGSPTGIVHNGSKDEFQVQGWKAFFLFATLDGTISDWAPQSNPNDALIAVDNSKSGAVYTGLAITNKASGNFLCAADLANNKVDVYDRSFNSSPHLPIARCRRGSLPSAFRTSADWSMLRLPVPPGLQVATSTSFGRTELSYGNWRRASP